VLKTEETLPFKNIEMEEGSDNPAAWQKGPPVAGVQQTWDRTTAHEGKGSLSLKKTVQRFFPIAQWSQAVTVVPVDKARKVRVRCWVKADNVTKAIVDVTYQGKQSGHVWAVFIGQKEQTDPIATHDWKLCEGTVEIPAQTTRLGIAFQIYGPGAVWFDDLEVAWIE
jgi:RNA polymerase sigma-70 factor (ECF subfamily)